MSGRIEMPRGGFLTLAPATSDSYPVAKTSQQAATTPTESAPVHRRTSSSSTTSSSSSKRRFLKLNPVHLGEHLGEDQADWHEVAVE